MLNLLVTSYIFFAFGWLSIKIFSENEKSESESLLMGSINTVVVVGIFRAQQRNDFVYF